jgi:hypothetical protein
MTFRSSIVEKTCTFPNETIHIMYECVVHLHGYWNKMASFMKPSILANINNGVKFHSCTYWLINDIQSHCLLRWVNNHHINNKDPILLSHVDIDL